MLLFAPHHEITTTPQLTTRNPIDLFLDFNYRSNLTLRYPTSSPSTSTTTSISTASHLDTMAPLTPTWQQPSHPAIQEVLINEAEFTTKSISRVSLPPFAVFARLAWPPCTAAQEPTYATVQTGRDTHLNLNSDLLYINHSCEPSLVSLTSAKASFSLPSFGRCSSSSLLLSSPLGGGSGSSDVKKQVRVVQGCARNA